MKRMILVIALVGVMMGNKSFGDGDGEGLGLMFGGIILTLPNLVFTGINIAQANSPYEHSGVIPSIGILTGGLEVYDGIKLAILDRRYHGNNEFSSLFVFVGSFTVISGILNLTANKKPQDTRSSWNLYSFPARDKSMGMGMSFSLRF